MLRTVLFVCLNLPGARASMRARRQVKSWYALKELCAVGGGVGGDTLTCKNHLCPAGAVTLEACGRGVCVWKLVEGVCVCGRCVCV